MITKQKLKEALIGELEARGKKVLFFEDLINDYLNLWEVKEALTKDIKEYGVATPYQNGKEQWGRRKNDSVLNLIKTNAQMLKILAELGLRGADYDGIMNEDL